MLYTARRELSIWASRGESHTIPLLATADGLSGRIGAAIQLQGNAERRFLERIGERWLRRYSSDEAILFSIRKEP